MVLVLRTRGSESSPIVLLVPRLISGSPAEKRIPHRRDIAVATRIAPQLRRHWLAAAACAASYGPYNGAGARKLRGRTKLGPTVSGLPIRHVSAAGTVARRASGAPHEGGAPLAEARRSAEEAPRAPSLIQHTHAIRVPGSHEDYRMCQPGSSTYRGRFRPRVRFMCVLSGARQPLCAAAVALSGGRRHGVRPAGRYAERAAAGDRYRPCLTLRIVVMPAGGGPAVTTSTSVRRTSVRRTSVRRTS